ncbi:unnamed protein product [Didymodactylos carnosus]|uniref:Uncharacterized protein n=1 Tax=Didymodactylos carnosus TaxID=1234261 RepID=A0A814MHX3_9BILA|nr:unnamed protein product [Didymodactylos carnosus]CAF1078209.1 unnamed protein product [Didymodactylos carnosus]CAF3751365.1 unnamed protein product [Didymodactylos carnosus]CAF3844429.1 unnamed protein product [Didymodactylos carnosus]
MECYPAKRLTPLSVDFAKQITYGNEQALQIHLDERFYTGEELELFYASHLANGKVYADFTKKIFYDPDQCIDFISSYEWKKVFLTLNDTFSHILPLIHDLPQIVYIYIHCESPDKISFDTQNYPKLRAIYDELFNVLYQLSADIETFKQDLFPINVVNPIQRKTNLYTHDKSKHEDSSYIPTQTDGLSIIWIYDDDKTMVDTSTIENKINFIKKFVNIDECIDYIHSLENNTQILFISSKLNNDLILPLIIKLTKIYFIYIFHTEENVDTTLNQFSNKIRGIHSDINNLYNQLLKDHNELSTSLQMSFSIFDKDKNEKTIRNLHKDNARFIWFQLLVDILIKIPHNNQTLDEMLNECEKYESKNESIQTKKIISQLRENYQSNEALQYYTADTFLYRLFNRALRTENIDILFVFRFFLADMYNQLQILYTKQFLNDMINSGNSLHLIRGQLMTITEFDIIKHNIGRLISINVFLSTTTDYHLACIFAGFDDQHKSSDKVSVVFQIEIDDTRHLLKRPFASLKEISKIKDEEEVLFSVGSVFRIENVENVPGNDKNWYVQLKLVNDDYENELTDLRNELEREFCNNCDLCNLGSALIEMGEYNKAERYFLMILEYGTQGQRTTATAYTCLGMIYHNNGDYPKALEYHQQALQLYTKLNEARDHREDIGVAHTHIGSNYHLMGNKQLALEYYNKAAEIQKLPWRITLEYLQKALKIEEDVVKRNQYHPSLATTYNNIGDTYFRMGDYNNALETLQHALKIRIKGTVSTHTDLAAIYHNLASVYNKTNCIQQALEMLEKALEIDTQALPENHPSLAMAHNNISQSYIKQGNHDKALYHIETALRILLKSNAKDNELFSKFQLNLSAVQCLLGDYTNALNTAHKVLENLTESLPENHPSLALTHNNIGGVYTKQGDYNKALHHAETAVRIMLKSNTEDNLFMPNSNLYNTKKISKATEYLEKFIENARLCILPYNQEKFLTCQKNYINLKTKLYTIDEKSLNTAYLNVDQLYNEGEQVHLLTLMNQELEEISSDNIRGRISLLNSIGTIHVRELNYEVAKKVFDDAISLYNQYQEVTLTKDAMVENLMILVYFNLARLYYRQEDWTTALQIFQKSLNMVFEQDQQHPQLAEIYNCLGLTYAHRRDCLKAEHYHRLAVEVAEKILPYDHPNLQRYQYQLGIYYQNSTSTR